MWFPPVFNENKFQLEFMPFVRLSTVTPFTSRLSGHNRRLDSSFSLSFMTLMFLKHSVHLCWRMPLDLAPKRLFKEE